MSKFFLLRHRLVVVGTVMSVVIGGPGVALGDGPDAPPGAVQGWAKKDEKKKGKDPDRVPAGKRSELLGKTFQSSRDRAWTTTGDAVGFHVLAADEREGYRWRTVATLSEPGFETDTWIGNVCVTDSGRKAAVAYAPRTFTNKADLMTRGAFTAIVDLETGKIKKLPFQATLAYFSPGCGIGDNAVFSQFTDDESAENATRLIEVDLGTGKARRPLKLSGQITSAVPVEDGLVAADGARLVAIDRAGKREPIAQTDGVPFRLEIDADGGVVFIDQMTKSRSGERQAAVERVAAAAVAEPGKKKQVPTVLATGKLTEFDLTASADRKVFVTGSAKTVRALPATVENPGGLKKGALVSTHAGAAVQHTRWADGKDSRIRPHEVLSTRSVTIDLKALDTGSAMTFEAGPRGASAGAIDGAGTEKSPALPERQRVKARTSVAPDGGIAEPDSVRTCSVPRGDPQKQAFQPKPRQVEWAVNRVIEGTLDSHVQRPANWKGMGMAAYSPQTLFPRKALSGGGRIPAQVLLGITAQESNMWQATRFAVPGVVSNPLIGNYYGVDYNPDGTETDPWGINWTEADCGYGVTQVTDGMRLPGRQEPVTRTTLQQEAIALDYTANIAAGQQILAEKWNQTRAGGLIVGDGDPQYLENWFFALWAYNSGYYPSSEAGEHHGKWGVGFTNNPANPLWLANRTPFLEDSTGGDDYSHAAEPQHWPYQEKVLGWAGRPLESLESPGTMVHGYRPAWWTSTANRTSVKPPIDLFCDASNECNPGLIGPGDSNEPGQGACTREDLHCWWNKPVQWKDCTAGNCGYELFRFDNTYDEEDDGNAYPPRCSAGALAGALIVDDLPNGTTPAGGTHRKGGADRGCGAITSAGTFELEFATPSGKMDTHQIGAGYGNHFWFSHTRDNVGGDPTGNNRARMWVEGTWTLNASLDWARVAVHIPDHGAHTRQASYHIHGTDSSSPIRVQPQRVLENKWVSLGVFRFTGTPKVTLNTATDDGNGTEDIAWDAVAFQPLPGKPQQQIVSMGDSYSAGEGAAEGDPGYFVESNYADNNPESKNGCHRSLNAWSRQATIPGWSNSIGTHADVFSNNLEHKLIACSGARIHNVMNTGQYHEPAQIKQGYLDNHTSLVTISIGGNDARFTDVVTKCVLMSSLPTPCQDGTIDGDSRPLKEYIPDLVQSQVRPDIVSTLRAIQTKAPNAKIMLMGYPRLFDDDGDCIPGIRTSEGQWMNSMGSDMNYQMGQAVEDAKGHGVNAWFADPDSEFAFHRICGNPESIHGIVYQKLRADNHGATEVSTQSFHPKIGGARLQANEFEAVMTEMNM